MVPVVPEINYHPTPPYQFETNHILFISSIVVVVVFVVLILVLV
ncbi:hypothetical protein PP707_06375 [Acetobacter pasteurianus]|nr:hypothetical protein [Acetobacter pasteurianus]